MEEYVKSLTEEQKEKVLTLTLKALEEMGDVVLENGKVSIFTEDGFENDIIDVAYEDDGQ